MANTYLDKNGLLYLWQKIIAKFVAKEAGKGLSTNDYTTIEKDKLGAIPGIKQIGSGLNLDPESGTLTATGGGTADSVEWANVQNKPTTLAGYGITDAAASSHNHDTTYYKKEETYTKAEIDGKGYLVPSDIANKADKAATLAGYGITDAYTKLEVDGKLSSVYKPAGNCLFADLPVPSASNLGNVYSMMDEFTTDERFVASEPTHYPIGTNVAVVQVMVEETPTYLFDVLAGFVDLSGYMQKTDMVAITNQEIDEIVAA